MDKINADIFGFGAALPTQVLTNSDLEKIVDTTDEWIKTRTGITERRIAETELQVSDLAAQAGLAAIEDASVDPDDIDLILVSTGSPEMIWPSTACLAQAKMGLAGCAAFDIQAACTGFSYGLAVANSLISSGLFQTVLLIGAETISRFLDWRDRSTCVLFGDGAAAVVLKPAASDHGVLASHLGADGRSSEVLMIPGGGSGRVCSPEVLSAGDQTIKMNGSEVFRFAVKILPESIGLALDKAGLKLEDVAFIIPHQANKRIIEAAVDRLGVSPEKVVSNLEIYGNTSAASIPLALEELYRTQRLKSEDIIVTAAFGAGLTWGANVIRWGGK